MTRSSSEQCLSSQGSGCEHRLSLSCLGVLPTPLVLNPCNPRAEIWVATWVHELTSTHTLTSASPTAYTFTPNPSPDASPNPDTLNPGGTPGYPSYSNSPSKNTSPGPSFTRWLLLLLPPAAAARPILRRLSAACRCVSHS